MKTINKIKSTDVFSYDNFRDFIAAYYESKKQEMPDKFSHRYFSRLAGFKAPNFIYLVIQGKRNLTDESIQKIANVMNLNNRPLEYFRALVHFNQAKTEADRLSCFEALKEFKEYIKARLLKQDQTAYLLKWYYPVVREMIKWPDFTPQPNWVAARIRPRILLDQAKEALEVLLALGLARVTKNGKWEQDYPKISTKDQGLGREIVSYHKQNIGLSQRCLEQPASDRNVSSVTMSISPALFEVIRRRLECFNKEINGLITKEVTKEFLRKNNIEEQLISKKGFLDVSEVCQLNMQYFKIAKSRGHNE
ncbi:MAG: TIGR02147 family protein [bacterium]